MLRQRMIPLMLFVIGMVVGVSLGWGGQGVEIVPRRVVIAIERSEGTRWMTMQIRSFVSDLVDQLDTGREVVVFEFASEPVRLAHSPSLTVDQQRLIRERIPRAGGRDAWTNFDELFGALREWSRVPSCLVLVTRGVSNPSRGHSFADVIRLAQEWFPASAGHSVLFVGLSDEVEKAFRRAVLPKEFSFYRLDTRISQSTFLLEPLLNRRLEGVLSPTPVLTRAWPTPTPAVIKSALATPTPADSPTPSRSPTQVLVPSLAPIPSTDRTVRPPAPVVVSKPIAQVKESSSTSHGKTWLWWVGGLTTLGAVAAGIRRASRRAVIALSGALNEGEFIQVLGVSVICDATSEVVASQDLELGPSRETVTIGKSAKARIYVPEVVPPVRFRITPDGTVTRLEGFRRTPCLLGSSLPLREGYSVFFEIRHQPIQEEEEDR